MKNLLKIALLLTISISCINAMDEGAEEKAFRAYGVDNPVQPVSREQIGAIIGDDAEASTIYGSLRRGQDINKWPESRKTSYMTFLTKKMERGPLTIRETRFLAALNAHPSASAAAVSELQGIILKPVVTKVAGGRGPAEQEDFTGVLRPAEKSPAAPAEDVTINIRAQVLGSVAKSAAEIDEAIRRGTQERLAKEREAEEAIYREATLGARLEIQARRNAEAIAQAELLQQRATTDDEALAQKATEIMAQLRELNGQIEEARASFAEASALKEAKKRRNQDAIGNQETADLVNMSVNLDDCVITPQQSAQIRTRVEDIMADPAKKTQERTSIEEKNNITDVDSAGAFIFGNNPNIFARYFLAKCFAADLVELAARQKAEADELLSQANAKEDQAKATLESLEEKARAASIELEALSSVAGRTTASAA